MALRTQGAQRRVYTSVGGLSPRSWLMPRRDAGGEGPAREGALTHKGHMDLVSASSAAERRKPG